MRRFAIAALLCGALILVSAIARADGEKRVALVVGNGAYQNVPQLDNPPRDAKLIAASLKDLGFQNVTVANDLTRDKFFETLRNFAKDAEKADWAVVY